MACNLSGRLGTRMPTSDIVQRKAMIISKTHSRNLRFEIFFSFLAANIPKDRTLQVASLRRPLCSLTSFANHELRLHGNAVFKHRTYPWICIFWFIRLWRIRFMHNNEQRKLKTAPRSECKKLFATGTAGRQIPAFTASIQISRLSQRNKLDKVLSSRAIWGAFSRSKLPSLLYICILSAPRIIISYASAQKEWINRLLHLQDSTFFPCRCVQYCVY